MEARFNRGWHALALAALSACGSSGSNERMTQDAGTAHDAAAGAHDASADAAMPPLKGTVERGEYLVGHVLVCGVCHTPSLSDGKPDPTKYLAGSRSYDFTDKDGTIVTVNAENLTTHDPEGLHAWSDSQIRRAITVGIDDEMIAIYPIMPYECYSLLTPDDVDSIIKYLRTVPPNPNVVAADYPYFDQNPPVPPLDEAKVPRTTLAKSDPLYASAERGRYLAQAACLYCHTEEVTQGVPNMAKAFGGGKKYTFVRGAKLNTSTNLTPDATGLAGWSIDDIVNALKTNTNTKTNKALCSSHPGAFDRLTKMQDADMRDIATYLHTLPPVKNGPFQCEAP